MKIHLCNSHYRLRDAVFINIHKYCLTLCGACIVACVPTIEQVHRRYERVLLAFVQLHDYKYVLWY